MLNEYDHDGESESPTMSSRKEVCKPDYEGMIKRTTEKLRKVSALKIALIEYLDNRIPRGKLAEMLGELMMKERKLDRNLQVTIKQQEEDTE